MSAILEKCYCSSCGCEFEPVGGTVYYLQFKSRKSQFKMTLCDDCGTTLVISEPDMFAPDPDVHATACAYCQHIFPGHGAAFTGVFPLGLSVSVRKVGLLEPVRMLDAEQTPPAPKKKFSALFLPK